jgi:glycosyltransferase involved in cell wall biosynthesis
MIRLLHYGLSENRGGIETYLRKIWTKIDRNEFHFDFIDTNIDKPCFYDEFSEMGSKFFKITPRKISIFKNRKDIEKLFRNENFDILHCHFNTLSYIAPIKTALKYGCKVIIHSRSSKSPNSLTTTFLHYINYYFLNFKYKNKIIRLAVSNKAGEWLFGNKNSFLTLNNGIEIDGFKFEDSIRFKKRDELELSDSFIVGHVGALNYPKNHEYLFKVFKHYLNFNKNAFLLLVGDGELKEHLINIARNMGIDSRVRFLGVRSDVFELICAMDIFVFPSKYEGFPNVVLEAQTTGLPCLISDNITDEVILSKDCISYSISKKPQDWAKKMNEISYEKNRETAYKFIDKSGFSVNEEIKKIEKIYLEIILNDGDFNYDF